LAPSIEGCAAVRAHLLSKTFGAQFALRNVDLEIQAGEFVTIFGPNGAGKTTLIRILSTLSKATSGDVIVEGQALGKDSDAIRRKIGVIGHQTFLYENLTAEENLKFYARLYRVQNSSDKITELLHDVGLETRRKDQVRTFSRGMQQRLSIARSLLHDPTLLLLDEPYTGLDQHASEMLTSWLTRLRERRQTTLMVTHDLERGVDLADRIAILVRGQVVFNDLRSSVDRSTFRQVYYDLVEKHNRQR